MESITTTDLSKFGYRERTIAERLLRAWREQGLPKPFYDGGGVTIMMNTYSGSVFLTNRDFQVAMMNGDKLELFYSCPICGHEGFLEEMGHEYNNPECEEYLRDIGAIKITRTEAVDLFKEEREAMINKYGPDDKSIIAEAWNNYVNMLHKDGQITSGQHANWEGI